MYGTIARMQTKPGMAEELQRFSAETTTRTIPGWIATYVYQMDAHTDEYYLAVVFESKDAYQANAGNPEQDQQYRRLRALLVADPEWHDGTIIFAHRAEGSMA